MPIYPLIIDNQARALISVAMASAARNPVSHAVLKALAGVAEDGEDVEPMQTSRDQTVEIPACYNATFTIEEQVPGHMFRHLSISILNGRPDMGPHPVVVDEIMREYGFQNSREDVQGWLETLADGRYAVNVLEPVDGDWEPFQALQAGSQAAQQPSPAEMPMAANG